MDITLEKIDVIRDRTGVTYRQAKETLESVGGNVVDALIDIEELDNKKWTESITVKGSEALDRIKNIVSSGNVNRIRVKKEEHTILDIPVTAGAIGAVMIPQITAIGTAVALLSKCVIEIERPNKEVINISDAISNTAGDVSNKMKTITSKFTSNHECPIKQDVDTTIDDVNFKENPKINTTIGTSNKYEQ